MKKLLLTGLFIGFVAMLPKLSFAQDAKTEKIDPEKFNTELMSKVIKEALFKFRLDKQLDTLIFSEDLQTIAQIEVDNAVGIKDKKAKKPKVIPKYTSVPNLEIILGRKADANPTYEAGVAQMFEKAAKKKEANAELSKPSNLYYGIGFAITEDNKKILVNILFGGIDAFPVAKKDMKSLPQKVSKKIKVGPYNAADCKPCANFDGSQILEGLYVENGKIFLKHNDISKLDKFFSSPADGFVIDVIQREQYTCEKNNIVNYYANMRDGYLTHKGKTGKFISRTKFLNEKKNRGDSKNGQLDIFIQKMPKKIKGDDYEFNVHIVKNKSNCKTVVRTFDEFPDGKNIVYKVPAYFLPDTSLNGQPRYVPKNETRDLVFKIPFERGKSTYNTKDIDNFIQALGEPMFTINKVTITSHSSIEADTALNRNLRIKRATSIVNAIDTFFAINKKLFEEKYGGKMQVENKMGQANPTITTNTQKPNTPTTPPQKGATATGKPQIDLKKTGLIKVIRDDNSWTMFQEQVKGTSFERLGKMTMEEVNNEFKRNPRLLDSLEPILAEERFAKIELNANLDYSHEEPYIQQMRKFKASLKNKDAKEALYMQKNLIILLNEGKINADTILKYDIPMLPEFATLHINKAWIKKKVKGDYSLTLEDYDLMKKLYAIASENDYVKFNYLYCQVAFSDTTPKLLLQRNQFSIDSLYKTSIPSKFVDRLNVEFQFDAIETLKNLKGQKIDVYKVVSQMPADNKKTPAKTPPSKTAKSTTPTPEVKEEKPESKSVDDLVAQRIEKLKKFFETPTNHSWENAFKAASIFYNYDMKNIAEATLKPFMITNDEMDQDVYFAYISLAGKDLSNTSSKHFRTALNKAQALNKERYCKLFGAPYCSYQLLDDPFIKATYCESCK